VFCWCRKDENKVVKSGEGGENYTLSLQKTLWIFGTRCSLVGIKQMPTKKPVPACVRVKL